MRLNERTLFSKEELNEFAERIKQAPKTCPTCSSELYLSLNALGAIIECKECGHSVEYPVRQAKNS